MAYNNLEAFWLLLVLPAFLIIWALLNIKTRNARNRFANLKLYETLTRSISRTKRKFRQGSYILGLFFLILALTGPRFGTKTEIVKRMGVDVVIIIDTSYSMLAEDIKPNRIMQSKYEIHRLIDNLQGDRVAIIAFAGDSIIQCPLTTDYGAAKTLLEYIDVGIVPSPGTNIQLAIEQAIDLLQRGSEAGSESQILILVTDGENIKGNPKGAASIAAGRGIRIFTIGIGTTGGEIIPIRNQNGELEDYKKDSKGNVVKTSLDEKTLENIANITNSEYIRTVNGEVDIQTIIDELGTMHKTDLHERKISRLKERYQIPLGFSLFFLLIWFTLGERRRRI